MTVTNMIFGYIASPINCGAITMVLSLILVPIVSFFTKPVPFVVKPPSTVGAIDREYVYGLKEQKIIDEQQKLRAARATESSVQEE